MPRNTLIKFVLVAFTVSRVFLSAVGIISRLYFGPLYSEWHEWHYSDKLVLDIWGVWDTGWYMDIAKNGYSQTLQSDLPKKTCCGQNNLGFFPLYPVLIRGLSFVTKNYYLSGLIISNTCLILSAIVLYKLVSLSGGENISRLAVYYLFLFPTSFILSGVFSESLFLLLTLLTFYLANKKQWFVAGITGYFMSLTRSLGIFLIIPLLYEYLRQKGFRAGKIKTDILALILLPLGFFSFSFFTLIKFNDFFAYFTSLDKSWGAAFTNPISVFTKFLFSGDLSLIIISIYEMLVIFLVIIWRNRINKTYFMVTLVLLFIPLFTGMQRIFGGPRYSVVIFPLYMLLAKIYLKQKSNYIVGLVLLTIQTFFMAAWVNGALII